MCRKCYNFLWTCRLCVADYFQDNIQTLRDNKGKKETHKLEQPGWCHVLETKLEAQRETRQVEHETRTVEEAAKLKKRRYQQRIAMESVEHQNALEENYVKERNGNSNAAFFLTSTKNVASTDGNFNPASDDPMTAPPLH